MLTCTHDVADAATHSECVNCQRVSMTNQEADLCNRFRFDYLKIRRDKTHQATRVTAVRAGREAHRLVSDLVLASAIIDVLPEECRVLDEVLTQAGAPSFGGG